MASAWTLQLHSVSFPRQSSSNVVDITTELGFNYRYPSPNHKMKYAKFVVRATSDAAASDEDNKRIQETQVILVENDKNATATSQNLVLRLQESFISFPPVAVLTKRHAGASFAVGLCIAAALLVVVVNGFMARSKRRNRPGSVADLVRRGQLRSDRRGISTPLKYEDPFNNPMVKVSRGNSSVEMCGKVYKLAPVTLTEEQRSIHQKRRSRAYQWKRPTIFLKEGDPVPPDVDPDTVRWIPANHPFATTASDIDEDLAQTNVYQKHGVPFRIKAEHEALQRRLEALQSEQKLGKLVIDPSTAKEFERPFKSHSKPEDSVEQNPPNGQVLSDPPRLDGAFNSSSKRPTEEI